MLHPNTAHLDVVLLLSHLWVAWQEHAAPHGEMNEDDAEGDDHDHDAHVLESLLDCPGVGLAVSEWNRTQEMSQSGLMAALLSVLVTGEEFTRSGLGAVEN